MSSITVHEAAAKGFGVGTNEHYDKSRPTYPPSVISYIQSLVTPQSSQGLNILELGSGTGLFSRLLVSPPSGYPSLNISSLLAVEPSEGMREAWDVGLEKTGFMPREGQVVKTIAGGFTDLSQVKNLMGDDWKADLVVIAQAWHWADPNYEQALSHIEPFIAPKGLFIPLWNQERQTLPLTRAIRKIEISLEAGTPQQHKRLWEAMFKTPTYLANFSSDWEKERRKFDWELVVTGGSKYSVDRTFSKSYVAVRSDEEKVEVKKRVEEAYEEFKGKDGEEKFKWVDEEKGSWVLPFETDVVVVRRKE